MGLTKSSEEDADRVMYGYAIWAKFMELTAGMVPWSLVGEISDPISTDILDDNGNPTGQMVTTIQIVHGSPPDSDEGGDESEASE